MRSFINLSLSLSNWYQWNITSCIVLHILLITFNYNLWKLEKQLIYRNMKISVILKNFIHRHIIDTSGWITKLSKNWYTGKQIQTAVKETSNFSKCAILSTKAANPSWESFLQYDKFRHFNSEQFCRTIWK